MSLSGLRWQESLESAACYFEVIHEPVFNSRQFDLAIFVGSVRAEIADRIAADDAVSDLEERGVRVLNSAWSRENAIDKYRTALLLHKSGLPHPLTCLAEHGIPESDQGWILKPTFGSMGRDVELYTNRDELAQAVVARDEESIIQSYHPGETIRIVSSSERALYAYKKIHPEGGPANVAQGAVRVWIDIYPELEDLAVRTTRALGADLLGVDIQESADGLRVIEANSNFTVYSEDLAQRKAVVEESFRLARTPQPLVAPIP